MTFRGKIQAINMLREFWERRKNPECDKAKLRIKHKVLKRGREGYFSKKNKQTGFDLYRPETQNSVLVRTTNLQEEIKLKGF